MIQRLPFVLIGLGIGIAVLAVVILGFDMVLNRGNMAAQHVHHQFPECSGSCHG